MAIFAKIRRWTSSSRGSRRVGANAAEVTISIAVLGLVVLLLIRAC